MVIVKHQLRAILSKRLFKKKSHFTFLQCCQTHKFSINVSIISSNVSVRNTDVLVLYGMF